MMTTLGIRSVMVLLTMLDGYWSLGRHGVEPDR